LQDGQSLAFEVYKHPSRLLLAQKLLLLQSTIIENLNSSQRAGHFEATNCQSSEERLQEIVYDSIDERHKDVRSFPDTSSKLSPRNILVIMSSLVFILNACALSICLEISCATTLQHETILQMGAGIELENIAVRSNGELILTALNTPVIHCFKPSEVMEATAVTTLEPLRLRQMILPSGQETTAEQHQRFQT
jgi:hypothetical protein